MLKRASPQELRVALEIVHHLKMYGIDFVPIPVTSQEQKKELLLMSEKALQELEKMSDES